MKNNDEWIQYITDTELSVRNFFTGSIDICDESGYTKDIYEHDEGDSAC